MGRRFILQTDVTEKRHFAVSPESVGICRVAKRCAVANVQTVSDFAWGFTRSRRVDERKNFGCFLKAHSLQ